MSEFLMSQRDEIIKRLKERGCRITKQRLILLDIILSEECASCKEIYYKAVQSDPTIGTATVYRMVNTLEEIGAINRKNMYKVSCENCNEMECACKIVLDDNSSIELSAAKWAQIVQSGLHAYGLINGQRVRNVVASPSLS